MDAAGLTVVIANLALGFGGAAWLAGPLARAKGEPKDVRWNFGLLIGVYFAESAAVAASMATMVLSITLAFVWAAVLGRWFRKSSVDDVQARKTALSFSIYSSLPALSLILIPVVAVFSGRSVVSAHEGLKFGIPSFVPWPMNTILGFFAAVCLISLVLKVVITTMGALRRVSQA